MNIYKHQAANVRKTWFLMTVFFLIVIGIGWVFSWIYDSPGILVFAVVFSILMNIFAYWYSDKLILKLYNAKEVTKETNRDLYNIVENLSITAGLPMPKVYIIEEEAPNAFATGRNPDNAVVAVTRGLLNRLEKSELEGVVAHELAHIGNRDMLISTIAVVLVGFVVLLSDLFLRMTIFGGIGGGDRDGRMQIILIVVGLALAILAPIFAMLLKAAISRRREYLADASGAMLTRYPEGLASALEKISSYQSPMKKANNATAHLFISNPFGAKAKKGMSRLFMTHPPTEDRIARLRGQS